MTNIKSVFGAGVWAAIASLMMLATLQPVELATDNAEIAAVATDRSHG